MANIQNGVAVNFALAGATVTGAGIGTGIWQSADYEKMRDKEEVFGDDASLKTRIWSNPGMKAKITYIVKAGGTATATLAAQTTLPDCGIFANISACDLIPDLVNTAWEVVGSSMKGTNKTVKEVTLDLEYHVGITAAASGS